MLLYTPPTIILVLFGPRHDHEWVCHGWTCMNYSRLLQVVETTILFQRHCCVIVTMHHCLSWMTWLWTEFIQFHVEISTFYMLGWARVGSDRAPYIHARFITMRMHAQCSIIETASSTPHHFGLPWQGQMPLIDCRYQWKTTEWNKWCNQRLFHMISNTSDDGQHKTDVRHVTPHLLHQPHPSQSREEIQHLQLTSIIYPCWGPTHYTTNNNGAHISDKLLVRYSHHSTRYKTSNSNNDTKAHNYQISTITHMRCENNKLRSIGQLDIVVGK